MELFYSKDKDLVVDLLKNLRDNKSTDYHVVITTKEDFQDFLNNAININNEHYKHREHFEGYHKPNVKMAYEGYSNKLYNLILDYYNYYNADVEKDINILLK